MSEYAWRLTEQAAGRSGDLPELLTSSGSWYLTKGGERRCVDCQRDLNVDAHTDTCAYRTRVVGYAPLPSPPRNPKVRAMDDTTLDDIPAEELQDLLLALREALRSRALAQRVRDHLQELYDDLEQGRARVLRGTAAAWRTRGRST